MFDAFDRASKAAKKVSAVASQAVVKAVETAQSQAQSVEVGKDKVARPKEIAKAVETAQSQSGEVEVALNDRSRRPVNPVRKPKAASGDPRLKPTAKTNAKVKAKAKETPVQPVQAVKNKCEGDVAVKAEVEETVQTDQTAEAQPVSSEPHACCQGEVHQDVTEEGVEGECDSWGQEDANVEGNQWADQGGGDSWLQKDANVEGDQWADQGGGDSWLQQDANVEGDQWADGGDGDSWREDANVSAASSDTWRPARQGAGAPARWRPRPGHASGEGRYGNHSQNPKSSVARWYKAYHIAKSQGPQYLEWWSAQANNWHPRDLLVFGEDGAQEFKTDAPSEVMVASNAWLAERYRKSKGKGKGKGKDNDKDKAKGKAATDAPAATEVPAVTGVPAATGVPVAPWRRCPF